jgi:hypothetical protein
MLATLGSLEVRENGMVEPALADTSLESDVVTRQSL